jgi:ORF6N domain
MKISAQKKFVAITPIEGVIHVLRERKIVLDIDLAELYGMKPIALRQQVKRNIERFPADFMFRLSNKEAGSLVSQSVIPHKKYLGGSTPYAFTQEGIAMLSSVLRTPRAIEMNIHIMRAFVRLRQLLVTHKDLANRVKALEQTHEKTDAVIEILIEDIDKLSKDVHWIKNPPVGPKRRIGFFVGKEDEE